MKKLIERNIEQKPIDYKDVINLGGERWDGHDSAFIDEFGFDWFGVTIKLTKKIQIDWDCNTRLCTMERYDGNYDKGATRVKEYPIEDLEELKTIVEFFKYEKL